MLDNPLRIMAFMWLVTGCLLTGEALILAPMGYQMETVEGNPFKSRLLTAIDQDRINEATAHIIAGSNGTINRVDDLDLSGAFMVWELGKLLAGMEIFGIMLLFGIPFEIVMIIIIVYGALMARSIVGYVFGR